MKILYRKVRWNLKEYGDVIKTATEDVLLWCLIAISVSLPMASLMGWLYLEIW